MVHANCQIAFKTSDESKPNDDTLANDSELVLPLKANTSYSLLFIAAYDSDTTAQILFKWAVPSGTVMKWRLGDGFYVTQTSAIAGPGGASPSMNTYYGSIITSSTAGDLQLTWAQAVSNAYNTTFQIGSTIEINENP